MRTRHVLHVLGAAAVLPCLVACTGQGDDPDTSPVEEPVDPREKMTLTIDGPDPQEIDCSIPDNGILEINAEGATLTLKGSCPEVHVNADDVTLSGDGADYLEVIGDHVDVDLQTSSWIFAKGDAGTYQVGTLEYQLETTGNDSTITFSTGDSQLQLDVTGTGNTITYTGDTVTVDDTGTGNTITKS